MKFLKKIVKKNKNNIYENLYDENGFFIGDINDDMYIDYEKNGTNHIENYDYLDRDTILNQIRNNSRKKTVKKEKQNFEDYQEQYYEEQFVPNENYLDNSLEKNPNINKKKQPVNVKIVIGVFVYIFFSVIGMFNTSFQDGYKPQIIDIEIKKEREIYQKTYEVIEFLENIDDFKGIYELQELSKSGQYKMRVFQLKDTLKEIESKLKEIEKMKVKENDKNIKSEMIDKVKVLLVSDLEIIQDAINYYETLTSSINTDPSLIENMKNQLLNKYDNYQKDLINYKERFEEIKKYRLLLDE